MSPKESQKPKRKVKDKLIDKAAGPLVSRLADDAPVTTGQIKELYQLLEKYDEENKKEHGQLMENHLELKEALIPLMEAQAEWATLLKYSNRLAKSVLWMAGFIITVAGAWIILKGTLAKAVNALIAR